MEEKFGAWAMIIMDDGGPNHEWVDPDDAPESARISFFARSLEDAREKFLPLICEELEKSGLSGIEVLPNGSEVRAVTMRGREVYYLTDLD